MGKVYAEIDDSIGKFISRQHMFFVATAPLDGAGHLNLSPKGLESFRVLNPRQVAYLDLTGSGIETVSHLRENGRIVIMFCAFEGAPKVLRLYGRGRALQPSDSGFGELRNLFPNLPGIRSVVVVEIDRIADSCGWGVPRYTYQGERAQLLEWAQRRGETGVENYRTENNRLSIDGLPGLRFDSEGN
jgi:hypothetical protein